MPLPRSKNLRIYYLDDSVLLVEGAGLRALKNGDVTVPFLTESDTLAKFPRVVVDMGAVRFVCNGAGIMRPGITEYTEFSEGDIVCIVEESRRKPLAVGRALADSAALDGMKRGVVVENLHHISDRFWEIAKTIPQR